MKRLLAVLLSLTCFAQAGIDDGLHFHWSFENTLLDSSANQNDAKIYGNENYGPGKLGQCFIGDGSTYIYHNFEESTDVFDEYSLSFWVLRDSAQIRERNIISSNSYDDLSDAGDFYFVKDDSQTLTDRLAEELVASEYEFPQETLSSQASLDWQHIVIVVDAGVRQLYLDGEAVASEYNDSLLLDVESIMSAQDNLGENFKGSLDEVRLYSRAIDTSEVVELFQEAGTPIVGQELLVNGSFETSVSNFNFTNNYKNLAIESSMQGQWLSRESAPNVNLDFISTGLSGQDSALAARFQTSAKRGLVQVVDTKSIDVSAEELSFSVSIAAPGRDALNESSVATYQVVGVNDFTSLTVDIGGTYQFTGGSYTDLIPQVILGDSDLNANFTKFSATIDAAQDFDYLVVLVGGKSGVGVSETQYLAIDGVSLTTKGSSNTAPLLSEVSIPDTVAVNTYTDIFVSASDPDGEDLSYAWSLVTGPEAVDFVDASVEKTMLRFNVAGDYVIKVVVSNGTDSVEQSESITVTEPVLRSASRVYLIANELSSTASAYGGSILNTVNDSFAYDVNNPTVALPAQGWSGSTGFHGRLGEAEDVTLSYSIASSGTVTLADVNDVFVLDFYGRNSNTNRDDHISVEFYNANEKVAELHNIAIADASPYHTRVDLLGPVSFDSFRVIGHDSISGDAKNVFTLMELAAAKFIAETAAPIDTDEDGLSDAEEALYGTNPNRSDSDYDGVSDGDEVALGTDPLLGNLLAYYKLDESMGTIAKDLSGYLNDAALSSAAWDVGQSGSALDARFATLVLPSAIAAQIEQEITISFWAKGDSDLVTNCVLYAVDSSGNRELNVHLPYGSSTVYFEAGYDEGAYDKINGSTPAQHKGVWNHWTMVKNTATGIMEVYLNGEVVLSGTGKTRPMNDIQDFVFGSKVNGSKMYFGLIDEISIFNRALNSTEINDLANGDFLP